MFCLLSGLGAGRTTGSAKDLIAIGVRAKVSSIEDLH
jgi:hypothetical protein